MYGKTPAVSGRCHFYSHFQNPSESSGGFVHQEATCTCSYLWHKKHTGIGPCELKNFKKEDNTSTCIMIF